MCFENFITKINNTKINSSKDFNSVVRVDNKQ